MIRYHRARTLEDALAMRASADMRHKDVLDISNIALLRGISLGGALGVRVNRAPALPHRLRAAMNGQQEAAG